MSSEGFQQFVNAVSQKPELQVSWNERYDSAPALVALAQENGYSLDEQELIEGLKALREADTSATGELDEDQLDSVSGGTLSVNTLNLQNVQFFEAWPCKWMAKDLGDAAHKI